MNLALPQANQFAKVCLAFLFISLQYNKRIMKTGAMAKPAGPDSKRLQMEKRCWEKWCSKMSNNRTIHVPIRDVCLTSVETSKWNVTEQGRCVNISSVNNSFLFFNWSGNLEDNSSSLSYIKINCTFCSANWSCLLLVSTPNSSCSPLTIGRGSIGGRNKTVKNEIPALAIAIGAVGGALVLLIVVLLCILFRSKARRRRELTLQSCTRNDAVELPQSLESSTREENETEQDDVNSELGSPSSVSSGEKDEDIFVPPPQMENPLRVGYVYPQDGKMALYSEGNSDRYSYPKFGTDSYQEDPADCYSYPVLRDGLDSGDSADGYSYPELRDRLYSGDSADGYSYPDLTDIPKVKGDTGEYCYAYAHTFNRRKPKCPHYVNVSLKKPKTCNSDSTRPEPKCPHYENVSPKKTKTCNSDSTRLEPEANVESPPIVEYIEACSDNEHNKAKESNDDVDTLNSTQHEENVESPVNVEYIPVL